MLYSMSRTLEVLPYICYSALAIFLTVFEVKNLHENLHEGAHSETGRPGFIIPPGKDSYEYMVSINTILHIVKMNPKQYFVYIVKGQAPEGSIVKHNRYGNYIKVRAYDSASVEKILDDYYERERR